MATLGIFTVKRVCHSDGEYFTYGGFGEYLESIRVHFSRVVLFARVFEGEPPEGFYRIPPGELDIVHLPAPTNEAANLLTLPLVVLRSWKHIKRLDVIHARMPDYTGVIGAWLGRLRGVPVFCQVIADWYLEAQSTPIFKKGGLGLLLKLDYYLYDLLERLTCRGKLVFAQGQSCYEKHRAASDCHLVLSSSHREADVVAPQERFRGSTARILTVARLTGVKNLGLLVRALAALVDSDSSRDWQLDVVGMGPKLDELTALAEELGLAARVNFHGQVMRGEALWDLYDNADVFVLPSRSEGTPKVLLEAMARGLPVVASRVGGIPTAIGDDERGLLFDDNDPTDLVRRVRELADDAGLRRRLAAAGSDFSRQHSLEPTTRHMIEQVRRSWPHLELRVAE